MTADDGTHDDLGRGLAETLGGEGEGGILRALSALAQAEQDAWHGVWDEWDRLLRKVREP